MDSNLSPWPFHESIISNTNPVAVTDTRDRALIERALNHKHMLETIERFEWVGLPKEIPSDLIERILYFRFKGALFKGKDGRFTFLPFTLKGKDAETIDSYGRYITITPVLFTGQWKVAGDGELSGDVSYMADANYTVVYDLPDDENEQEFAEDGNKVEQPEMDNEDKAVILTDSSLEISQDYTPMAYLCRPFNEQLTDILVLVNMDLITSAKAFYIVAKDEDQKQAIEAELAGMDRRILNGKRYVVVTSPVKLEELMGSPVKDTARYFQSYQSIDNLRKDLIGENNGGTFMKQEHTTDKEMETNSNGDEDNLTPVMKNAFRMRKDFCNIANKVFGLKMDVKPSKTQTKDKIADKGAQTKDRESEEGDE